MSAALTRWRTRCQAAIETGAGLPLLGDRPDHRLARGLRIALDATAKLADSDAVLNVVRRSVLGFPCAPTGIFTGLLLARDWLDEERAADAALTAEASK